MPKQDDASYYTDYKCRRCNMIFRPFGAGTLDLTRHSVNNALRQFGFPLNLDEYKVPMLLVHDCSGGTSGIADLYGYSKE